MFKLALVSGLLGGIAYGVLLIASGIRTGAEAEVIKGFGFSAGGILLFVPALVICSMKEGMR